MCKQRCLQFVVNNVHRFHARPFFWVPDSAAQQKLQLLSTMGTSQGSPLSLFRGLNYTTSRTLAFYLKIIVRHIP